MTKAEPQRAEAWFYLGAAYGVRAQFRVHRVERLAAARDGKRIKESLERALALDPEMHDAEFGIGMYRYYADIAPAVFRFLRFLLLMPGGDRVDGLRQLERAATRGMPGPRRSALPDPRALSLVRKQVAAGAGDHPRRCSRATRSNPLFRQIEAEILDVYFHDAAASLKASEQLLALAASGAVHRADIAAVVARLNIARQSIALKQPIAPPTQLDRLIAMRPRRRRERLHARSRCGARSSDRRCAAIDPATTSRHDIDEDVRGRDRSAGQSWTTTNALCLTTDFSHP